jgi:hypothetical protein
MHFLVYNVSGTIENCEPRHGRNQSQTANKEGHGSEPEDLARAGMGMEEQPRPTTEAHPTKVEVHGRAGAGR